MTFAPKLRERVTYQTRTGHTMLGRVERRHRDGTFTVRAQWPLGNDNKPRGAYCGDLVQRFTADELRPFDWKA